MVAEQGDDAVLVDNEMILRLNCVFMNTFAIELLVNFDALKLKRTTVEFVDLALHNLPEGMNFIQLINC